MIGLTVLHIPEMLIHLLFFYLQYTLIYIAYIGPEHVENSHYRFASMGNRLQSYFDKYSNEWNVQLKASKKPIIGRKLLSILSLNEMKIDNFTVNGRTTIIMRKKRSVFFFFFLCGCACASLLTILLMCDGALFSTTFTKFKFICACERWPKTRAIELPTSTIRNGVFPCVAHRKRRHRHRSFIRKSSFSVFFFSTFLPDFFFHAPCATWLPFSSSFVRDDQDLEIGLE